jgi:hypothetical protein
MGAGKLGHHDTGRPVDEGEKQDGDKDIQSKIEPMRERLVFEEAK